jgi:hypothetical protein
VNLCDRDKHDHKGDLTMHPSDQPTNLNFAQISGGVPPTHA